MGLLLDIVPNHMSASSENRWWMDVLENGASSPYAQFFDIDWCSSKKAVKGKVLLPILEGPYGRVLENQELSLSLEESGFLVRYSRATTPPIRQIVPPDPFPPDRDHEGDLRGGLPRLP